MLLQSLLFLAGLGVLYVGAEWLIRGAASLALKYGIRPLIVGLTVVALGTSMPEFVVNFIAALSNEDSLALGNIIGSNICNIGLILGTSSVVLPLVVSPDMLRKEYPIMLGVMFLFYIVSMDGIISKLDGLLLILGLVAFLTFLVLDARRNARRMAPEDIAPVKEDDGSYPTWKKALHLGGGILLLAAGAQLMVYAAVNIAHSMGVDPMIVGLTVVAIGTSLPELAASIVGAVRNEADLSVGNVLGSNLLNVLFVVGLVSLVRPLEVDAVSIKVHFPIMLAFSIVLLPVMWTQYQISRREGVFLLGSFVMYLAYLVYP